MSMTQGEAATAAQLPMSAKGRKISTAKGGSVTFWDSAGVWSRLALIAVPMVPCSIILGISTIVTTLEGSSHLCKLGAYFNPTNN